ncbi:Glycosyl hydrolase family 92 [Posidoniimonas corsicana]|uniref:Glycosyl hydrolase family 92 n=1 Tax=Posidoniimonas corsicana TaxID=1938618 RepID=A0A5C5VHA9_9BACT|nr:GH92 family glycosyl hydrolase [Posidoniimonas corsicana]TWT37115.1 Glycosyl hydrolase family 92 [Posidoniimonas corsicana]
MKPLPVLIVLFAGPCLAASPERLVDYVNPLLGTTTLWDKEDIGYEPTHRVWGGEVFPGSSVPNAMVQLTPVTQFRSGSGYQYEDGTIYGFAHTSKGHWNLCHVPLLPATTGYTARDYASPFSHDNESAHPGYYQVYLERYGVDAELTSTRRCAVHRYTFKEDAGKRLLANLSRSNERVREWDLEQDGPNAFSGFQRTGDSVYFYAVANHPIDRIETLQERRRRLPVVHFQDATGPLELRIGFSFVSVENARQNLEHEVADKSFQAVRDEASAEWEKLLGKVRVEGGTERQRRLFYSCLYRSFLWPALRSDVNQDFAGHGGERENLDFDYYTMPSLWDDYRNKLVLLEMLSPGVTSDVIRSMIYRAEPSGFMPTFFHGDHAAPFIAGAYLRGLRGFDAQRAYELLLRNATLENRTRPHVLAYIDKGYVPEQDVADPVLETVANAGVTKTLEYAYDDYAVARLAEALGDADNQRLLMQRTGAYKNVFDESTGFMRGRLASGEWIKEFDPERVFYEYMYREANAWQSTFFAPHDVPGLVALYGGPAAFEEKLDKLFSTPFTGREAYNMSVFLGQYCHGNQPDHNYPYLYTLIGKPEKSQRVLDHIMQKFYGMGPEGLAYAGMDDAGEMSAWYVFAAMGFYPFSPADPEFVVSAPLFDKVEIQLGDSAATIRKAGGGRRVVRVESGGRELDGFVLPHPALTRGDTITISTEE